MANVDDPVGAGKPADVTAGADASAVSDPRDARIAELEDYAARASATFERLKPYEADIEALEKGGEEYVKFSRSSRESYYDMQKRLEQERQDEIPESEKRILNALDERLGKFKPVLDDYESRAQTEARTAKEASATFVRENLEYAQRLIADQKLSPEEVQDLGRFAKVLHEESVEAGAPRFVPLEEVYKRVYGRAEAKVTAAKPVPRSQRATAGATGVPGATRSTPDRGDLSRPGGLTTHLLSVLNNSRKAG